MEGGRERERERERGSERETEKDKKRELRDGERLREEAIDRRDTEEGSGSSSDYSRQI